MPSPVHSVVRGLAAEVRPFAAAGEPAASAARAAARVRRLLRAALTATGARVFTIAVLAPLLALMPLLHAHPIESVGGRHPVGLHMPVQVVVAEYALASPVQSVPQASQCAPVPALPPTIVVEEGRVHGDVDVSARIAVAALAAGCVPAFSPRHASAHAAVDTGQRGSDARASHRPRAPPRPLRTALT